MEHMIQLLVEKLPEGVCLATSDEVQGLAARGRTVQETIEIARDVAGNCSSHPAARRMAMLAPVREAFVYPSSWRPDGLSQSAIHGLRRSRPHFKALGPNEFLHVPCGKKLTVAVARVTAAAA